MEAIVHSSYNFKCDIKESHFLFIRLFRLQRTNHMLHCLLTTDAQEVSKCPTSGAVLCHRFLLNIIRYLHTDIFSETFYFRTIFTVLLGLSI